MFLRCNHTIKCDWCLNATAGLDLLLSQKGWKFCIFSIALYLYMKLSPLYPKFCPANMRVHMTVLNGYHSPGTLLPLVFVHPYQSEKTTQGASEIERKPFLLFHNHVSPFSRKCCSSYHASLQKAQPTKPLRQWKHS